MENLFDPQELEFLAWCAGTLLCLGILLSWLNSYTAGKTVSAEKRIEKLLPGINCGQCGCPSCRSYAAELAAGKMAPNLCHPGGPDTARDLCSLIGISFQDGEDYDEFLFAPRRAAFIHQDHCTGCGRCRKVCPVDAISGRLKQPYLIAQKDCTACGDCLKTCPEDCIEMLTLPQDIDYFDWKITSTRLREGGK